MDNRNILVTAIGTMAATSIVQELKRNLSYIKIIGADTNAKDQIVTSREVDEFYQFPSCVEDTEYYMKFLIDFCDTHNVKYIFSTIDEEVYGLTQKEKLFQSMGIKLCIPDVNTVRTCHFKNIFSKWVEKNIPEIVIREYQDIALIPNRDFPIFVKPVEGRASNGCEILHTSNEADIFCQHHNMNEFVVQKYIIGDIVSVDIVRDRVHSVIKICQRLETLRNKNGCGIAVEIVDYPILREICFELADKLDLNGVINAEFFKIGNTYKIIEVNPRFSAGTVYSCRSGLNTVIDAFKIANSEDISDKDIQIGMKFARRYEAYEC